MTSLRPEFQAFSSGGGHCFSFLYKLAAFARPSKNTPVLPLPYWRESSFSCKNARFIFQCLEFLNFPCLFFSFFFFFRFELYRMHTIIVLSPTRSIRGTFQTVLWGCGLPILTVKFPWVKLIMSTLWSPGKLKLVLINAATNRFALSDRHACHNSRNIRRGQERTFKALYLHSSIAIFEPFLNVEGFFELFVIGADLAVSISENRCLNLLVNLGLWTSILIERSGGSSKHLLSLSLLFLFS